MLDDPGLRNATFVPLEVSRRPLDVADGGRGNLDVFIGFFSLLEGERRGKLPTATVPPPSESLEAALPQLGDC